MTYQPPQVTFLLYKKMLRKRNNNCIGMVKKGDDFEKTEMKNQEIPERKFEVRDSISGVTMMVALIEQVEAYMRQAYNIPSRILCKVVLFLLEDTTQDVVAKDLHGKLWRFHHIYRGNLKRDLLSTLTKMLLLGVICTFFSQLYGDVRMSSSTETRKSAHRAGLEGKKEEKKNRRQNVVEEGKNKVTPTSGRIQERRAIKTKSLAQVTESSLPSVPNTHLRDEARLVRDHLVVGGNRPSRYRMPEKNFLECAVDLLKLKDGHGFFAYPVDCSKVAGYLEKIKQPVDFSTIRAKLADNMYQTLEEYELDVLLLSKNAMHFNPNTSLVFEQARIINQLLNEMLKVLKANLERFSVTGEQWGMKLEHEASGTTSCTAGRCGRPRLNKKSLKKSVIRRKQGSCIDDADETSDEFVIKRVTFLSSKNLVDDAKKPMLTIDNGSKNLVPVFKAAGSYEESLKRFCQSLGAMTQRVAERQLSKLAAINQPRLWHIVSPAPPPSRAANLPTMVRGNDLKGKMVI